MYIDLRTGELIDPFGGLADLREGCIRATDARTFTEDPLRVLRVMQTLPRKGKYVDASTIALCASIVDEYDTLPKERVFEEFKKLLLLTKTPAMGFLFLHDCGWLKKFPALDALIGCAQHPVHHPEGDVWMHTLYTLDHAAAMRDQLPEEWRLAFMFGMLCHDFGKPAVTDPVEFTAHQHESEGEKIARQFMKTLSDNVELIEKTAAIVLTHMRPYAFYKAGAKEGAWKRLHNIVPLHILAYVTQADASGRAKEAPAQYAPEFELCLRYANAFGKGNIQPVLLGRHLIERGHPPGVGFRAILDQGYQYQLDSGSTDVEDIYRNALKGVDESNHNAPD
jgi:tRNA nucleotidyltransferase (CCA-adding enzyme)